MKPLHLPKPVAAHRTTGQRHARVADVLRQPVRRPGHVRTPDRRAAIANLRARYRPMSDLLRLARGLGFCLGLALLAGAFLHRDPHVDYPSDPAGYGLALALLRAECGDRACRVTLDRDRWPRDRPSPELADAMGALGLRAAERNPWVGESWFAANDWEHTALHQSETPTAEQLRVRRNRERAGYEGPGAGWTSRGDGWLTRAPKR